MSEPTEKQKDKTELDSSDPLSKVVITPGYKPKTTDSFTLLETSMKGDNLIMLVQYGGGCQDHEWNLVTNGAYAKSLPPQITVNLEHNANGDMCRALLRDTLEFEIAELKYPGSMELIIKPYNFEDKSVKYRY